MISPYDLRDHLHTQALSSAGPMHVRAFSAWLLGDADLLRTLVADAVTTGQQRHTDHIAVLGYASASGLLTDDEHALLRDDIAHLAGRAYFVPGRTWRFELDGVALLGVSLGASALGPDTRVDWLADLLLRSSQEMASDAWNLGLTSAARVVVSNDGGLVQPPELAVALASKGVGALPENLEEAWIAATSLSPAESADRAAARMATIDDLAVRAAQITPRAATREDLIAILEGTARSLKRWPYGDKTPRSQPALWEIANEYNVQDLLWALLAPIFPDLEDEEELPSLGPKHPRVDLGVPKLRTLIEIKYLRQDSSPARSKLIDEVAADASLYFAKTNDYDGIIAYVWDDAAQTDQHHEIKMGLEAIRGIIAAVIVPRPAKMARGGISTRGTPGKNAR